MIPNIELVKPGTPLTMGKGSHVPDVAEFEYVGPAVACEESNQGNGGPTGVLYLTKFAGAMSAAGMFVMTRLRIESVYTVWAPARPVAGERWANSRGFSRYIVHADETWVVFSTVNFEDEDTTRALPVEKFISLHTKES